MPINGVMDTYRFQSHHFPAMVADISLESLNSPSLEDVNFSHRYKSEAKLDPHFEDTINQNIETNDCVYSKLHSQLPELDNAKEPVDKLLNMLNDKLSPQSRMRNVNDWELQASVHEDERRLTVPEYQDYSVQEAISESMNASAISDSMYASAISENMNASYDSFTDGANGDSGYKRHITSPNKPNSYPPHKLRSSCSDNIGVKFDLPKPDIVSSHEIKEPRLPESRISYSVSYPRVAIKSLNDGNDGSYEICIQNIFTSNVIPVCATPENVAKQSSQKTLNDANSCDIITSHHKRPCSLNTNRTQLKGQFSSKELSLENELSKSPSITLSSKQYDNIATHNQPLPTSINSELESKEQKDPATHKQTGYARLISPAAKTAYSPLNLPYHTIRSSKTSPLSFEKGHDSSVLPISGLEHNNAERAAERFTLKTTRRRRPRLLPKIPSEPPKRFEELFVLKSDHDAKANEVNKELTFMEPLEKAKSTTEPADVPISERESNNKACRPKSWCGAFMSNPTKDEECIQNDLMTRSLYTEKADKICNLPNTLSLASELCNAEAVERELQGEDWDDVTYNEQSPFCSTKERDMVLPVMPQQISFDDLGSPEVIEPPCLIDSGFQPGSPECYPETTPTKPETEQELNDSKFEMQHIRCEPNTKIPKGDPESPRIQPKPESLRDQKFPSSDMSQPESGSLKSQSEPQLSHLQAEQTMHRPPSDPEFHQSKLESKSVKSSLESVLSSDTVESTPEQVKILNQVNKLKSETTKLQNDNQAREEWLKGLLTSSFCNKCRSTNPFEIMEKSLTEQLGVMIEPKKSPTDLYIDDVPKSKQPASRKLTLEFQKEKVEVQKGRYDLDKNALQLHFLQTPMDDTADPFPLPAAHCGTPVQEEEAEFDLYDLEITHRCCHKFIPRHPGELFIEIGDPLYVEQEEDDLWCKGLNLRTKKKGIFPSVCATDLNFQDGLSNIRPVKYYLYFLGSLEVGPNHKSNRFLKQAIDKVSLVRRQQSASAPPLRCLEINYQGIRMSNKVKAAALWSKKKSRKTLEFPQDPDSGCSSQSDEPAEKSPASATASLVAASQEHFFSLKNLSFCGCHPDNDKYFAFITKHPLHARFACHVYMGDDTTRHAVDAIGRAFKTYTAQYLASSHPTEDIYIE